MPVREDTYAWMINQNHRIVPANIAIEENRLQDGLEVVRFGDRGWKAVQGLGAAILCLWPSRSTFERTSIPMGRPCNNR